jgi:hypothetical protein
MSQLVKTKRQAYKDFKRFGAFKGLVEQKNVVFNLFVYKLGFLWHSCLKEPNLHTNLHTNPIYTGTLIPKIMTKCLLKLVQ